jgi:hypothetical protein
MGESDPTGASMSSNPSEAQEVVSGLAVVFGIIVLTSALFLDPENCAVGIKFRLAGSGVALALFGSALATYVSATRPQYARISGKLNLLLGVLGWLALAPWVFILLLVSSCH